MDVGRLPVLRTPLTLFPTHLLSPSSSSYRRLRPVRSTTSRVKYFTYLTTLTGQFRYTRMSSRLQPSLPTCLRLCRDTRTATLRTFSTSTTKLAHRDPATGRVCIGLRPFGCQLIITFIRSHGCNKSCESTAAGPRKDHIVSTTYRSC